MKTLMKSDVCSNNENENLARGNDGNFKFFDKSSH